MDFDSGTANNEASLRIVCSGVQHPTVDIVSIPSLPQLLPKYQHCDQPAWINDVFTHHFPSARVIIFRYDFAKSSKDACWLRMLQEATALLYGLVHHRSTPTEMNRPLVFVCHGFGGVILKQALISAVENNEFSSIFESAAGVLFFGCIHNPSPSDFKTCCLRCAAVEMQIPLAKHEISSSLKASGKWDVLRDTLERFRQIDLPFPIWTFSASRKTSYKSHRLRPAESSLICPEPHARLNAHNEQFLQVDMDHIQLSSFPSRSHPLFQRIITIINEILTDSQRGTGPDAVQAAGDGASGSELLSSSYELSGEATPVSSDIPDDLLFSQTESEVHLPYYSIFPHKENPNFVGRADILTKIHQALRPDVTGEMSQKVFALCGLGGIGKTQIAIKFAKEHMDSYQVVLFAHADEITSLLEDFSRFAADLGIVDADAPNQQSSSDSLRKWLETTDVPWLLIFDNADNPESTALDTFWPRCSNGSILITSRVKSLVVRLGGDILPPLRENDAVELLMRLAKTELGELSHTQEIDPQGRASSALDNSLPEGSSITGSERKAAFAIVHRVGCLPLGICQAANLILKDSCLLPDFVLAYDYRDLVTATERTSMFKNPNEESYRHDLSTVWLMNFESLNQDSQILLNVLSFFHPDRIPLELLSSGAEKATGAGHSKWSVLDNTRKFTKCKASILHSSLVDQSPKSRTLSMHRLVQQACQHRMSMDDRQDVFLMALCLLDQEWPVAPRNNRLDPSFWPKQQSLLPHVLSLCRFYEESQQEESPLQAPKSFAELLYNASRYTYERGVFEHSEPLLHVAEAYSLSHEACELILADIYGSRAAIANQINMRQTGLTNFELQYTYINKAIETGLLRQPDIRICFALGGLGNGYQGMNHYEEAVQWYHKCYEAWNGVEGDQRLYGANLAFCLIWQGKLQEAEETLSPLITPPSDTSFRAAGVQYALGNLEIAKGLLDKAFQTHLNTFRAYKMNMGEKHHKTADIYHKIGWHYHVRKEYQKAIEMLNQALTVFEEHPSWYKNESARTKYKLGCVLQDSGRFEEGTRLIEDAETLRKEILGQDVEPGNERSFDELVMFWSR